MRRILTRRNLILGDIWLMAILGLSIYVFVTQVSAGAGLRITSSAYELNQDDAGRLWISATKAGQVWGLDPTNGNYEIYQVSGSPVDARQAGGWVWWADAQSNGVGQVSTTDGSFTEWQIPDAPGFLGTSIDSSGRLYVTDSSNPYLYRLDANKAELCIYNLPGFGASNYIVRAGDDLWLGDWFDATIIRYQPGSETLTWWVLPAGSSPLGMAVDGQGYLWYADQGNAQLTRLDPTANQLAGYLLPIGKTPQMVVMQSGAVWYTEQSTPGYGRLDPSLAKKSITPLEVHDQQADTNCTSIAPSATGKVPITKGIIKWADSSYPVMKNAEGWRIYQLPQGSDPWGIAVSQYGYILDAGHQALLRFAVNQ